MQLRTWPAPDLEVQRQALKTFQNSKRHFYSWWWWENYPPKHTFIMKSVFIGRSNVLTILPRKWSKLRPEVQETSRLGENVHSGRNKIYFTFRVKIVVHVRVQALYSKSVSNVLACDCRMTSDLLREEYSAVCQQTGRCLSGLGALTTTNSPMIMESL